MARNSIISLVTVIAIVAMVIPGCAPSGPFDLTMAVSPPGGGTTTPAGTMSVAAGTQVNIQAVAAAGYYFVGWTATAGGFANANAATTKFTMPALAATVTANFVLEELTGAWLDEVVIRQEPSSAAAIAQLEADELDLFACGVADATLYAQVLANPDLKVKTSVGSYNEYTFNPVGPFFSSTGTLNPFHYPQIRETINWLIDRTFIVTALLGGLGVPRYTVLNGAFEAAVRYPGLMTAVEAFYAHTAANVSAAWIQLSTAMLAIPGVTYVDDKWYCDAEQVELMFLIRVEDERVEMGDYLADLLEDWGFSVTRFYGTGAVLAEIWQGDPALGLWHIYTGGWVSTVISRDEGWTFGGMYTDLWAAMGPLWVAYGHAQPWFPQAEQLWNNDFATMALRAALFGTCMWGTMADSVRVFTVTRNSFTPMRADVDMAADTAGGVCGSWMWALTAHFMDDEGEPLVGGSLRVAMPGILTQPWNPLACTNWVYDMFPIRATGDMGHHPDTRTGLRWAGRIEKAEVTVETGLPVAVTNTEWCSLTFQTGIVVPDDAWADWDAVSQEFITAAVRFPNPADRVALMKTVSYYPKGMFDEIKLHDGSALSMGDFVLSAILEHDRSKIDGYIYDAGTVSSYDAFMSMFKGVKFITDDPNYDLIVEYYTDNWSLDAENGVATYWPNYSQGNGFWHVLALGIEAEHDLELAFGKTKATALGVEWMSFIAGPSLPILKAKLDAARAATYPDNIPYAPTLGDYIDADEATERYDNLYAWYMDPVKVHFWVSSGPFYLQRASPIEEVVHLRKFEDYPDLSTRWTFLAEPLP